MDWVVVAKFISLENVTPEHAQKIFNELYNLKTLGCQGINIELVREKEHVGGWLYKIGQSLDEIKEKLGKTESLEL